jgi:hypothetical protein
VSAPCHRCRVGSARPASGSASNWRM